MANVQLSILVYAEKDSKDLSRLIHSLMVKTHEISDCEVLVTMHENDKYNEDLRTFYYSLSAFQNNWVRFFMYDNKTSDPGDAIDQLFEQANGKWVVEFTDKHRVSVNKWNKYLLGKANTDETEDTDAIAISITDESGAAQKFEIVRNPMII